MPDDFASACPAWPRWPSRPGETSTGTSRRSPGRSAGTRRRRGRRTAAHGEVPPRPARRGGAARRPSFRRLTGRTGPGAGRPTKLYRPSTEEVAVSVPERHYDLAGQLMAAAIESATTGGTDVVAELHRAAAQHGGTLGRGSDPADRRPDESHPAPGRGRPDARRARVPAAPGRRRPHADELPLPRPGSGPHTARLRHEPRSVGPGGRGCRADGDARPGAGPLLRGAVGRPLRRLVLRRQLAVPARRHVDEGAPRFDNDRREREELSTPPVTKPGSGAIVVMSALLVVGQGRTRCGRRRTGQGRACCCRLLLGHYVEARARWTPARPTNRLEGSLLAPVINGVRPGGRATAIQHPCHYSCVRGRTRCNSGDAFTAGVMTDRARPADDESGKSRAGR